MLNIMFYGGFLCLEAYFATAAAEIEIYTA
jgi:hypothetical protein